MYDVDGKSNSYGVIVAGDPMSSVGVGGCQVGEYYREGP